MRPPVEIEDLVKVFGSVPAVAGLSLHVKAGEIYGLLGPNGAGKTTTLRILAGLIRPSAGRAFVAGIDVATDPDGAKKRLGFMTGSTGLYGRLSVRELLTYFGRLYEIPREALEQRVTALARNLEFERLLDRRCEGLSTGEKQRISIARAVLHHPTVLILDEPTNGLDVLASRFLRALILAERTAGKAIIFSTHYLAEAELLCDRVGLMYQGRLLREGSPARLREEAGAPTLEEAFLRLVESHPAPPPETATFAPEPS